jgi:hypothetical protein
MVAQWMSRCLLLTLLVVASVASTGCEVIGDIFKAGVWVGVLMVVVLIAIVGVIAAKVRG